MVEVEPSKKRQEPERSESKPEVDLRAIFRPPTGDSSDQSDVNNPWNFRNWWNTIQAQEASDYLARSKLYYQAVEHLPGSYKLWFHFLKETRKYAKQYPVDDPRYSLANDLHEKALIFMNKMPIIWLKYAKFLARQKLITRTRHAFDNALRALPATQHEMIWKPYAAWAKTIDCVEVSKYILQRYVAYNPDAREEYIDYLTEIEDHNEAALEFIKIINDEDYVSSKGHSKHATWMALCGIIAKYPEEVQSIDCEAVIRHAIKLYTDEVGNLWVALAEYYIRQGYFEKARNIFEEAIDSISTTRDFGIIFNAYSKFEEQIVNTTLAEEEAKAEKEPDEEKVLSQQISKLVHITMDRITDKELENGEPEDLEAVESDPGFIMYRIENLLERRPFLLSHVVLRQNPNNVYEWLNLAKLCEFDEFLALKTYTEAVLQIDPQNAYGKVSNLWIRFAQFYEERDDIGNANQVFSKATAVNYKTMDELAAVWCAWAEMHVRHHNYESARTILKEACSRRTAGRGPEKTLCPALSHNIWAFYADIETALGSFQNVRAIYQKMLDMQLATPQTILNYGAFLENSGYYEDSFRVYEKAVNAFQWPHVNDIWIVYLAKFTERYGGSKMERLRDLFEQVIKTCPQDKLKFFYYMYADVEEGFGLYNRAIDIYDRALRQVNKDEMLEVLKIAIAKTAKFFGLSKTRKIYEKAFEILPPNELIDLGMKYSKMERKLGEIDRARAIYMHLSQYCNPKSEEMQDKFWKIWEQFEIMHGSEETFKDFLKIQRYVGVKYSIQSAIQPAMTLKH